MEIDKIVPLEDFKAFLIYICFSSKKKKENNKDVIELLLENKDLFLMRAPRIIVKGNEIIPYRIFGANIIVKVNNLKEILITFKDGTNLKFIPINENEGRLIGTVSQGMLGKLNYSKIVSFEELGIKKIKRKVERKASEKRDLEIIINEEIKEERKVKIAHVYEHYDLISYGNSPEDIRYIEVKRKRSKNIKKISLIKLTDDEFEIAKKFKDKYWVYFIIPSSNSEYKIIKIQNPAEKLKWGIMRRKGKIWRYYSYIPLNLVI